MEESISMLLKLRYCTKSKQITSHMSLISTEWGQIEDNFIEGLFQNMPAWVQVLLMAKGVWTKC